MTVFHHHPTNISHHNAYFFVVFLVDLKVKNTKSECGENMLYESDLEHQFDASPVYISFQQRSESEANSGIYSVHQVISLF